MGDVTHKVESKGHSLLSPSSSSRWMRCPGSVWLSKDVVEQVSKPAEEGSAAHSIAELCLRSTRKPSTLLGTQVLSPVGLTYEVTQEMADALNVYTSSVWARMEELREDGFQPTLYVEKEFDLYDGLCSGTADAMIVWEEGVDVFDLKYGQGVEVTADWNSQMLIYALGAVKELDLADDVLVTLMVVQPRHFKDKKVKEFSIHYGSLLAWEDFELLPTVDRAKVENKKYCPGTVQCQWCSAALICPAIKEQALVLASESAPVLPEDFPLEVAQFSPEQLASALRLEASFKKWTKGVQKKFDEAKGRSKELLEGGLTVPGYKIVAGRASRSWTDEEYVIQLATADNVEPYETKLRSVTQLEKLYLEEGLATKELRKLIVVKRGVDVVPMSNKKKAIPAKAEAVFEGINKKGN